MPYTLKQETKLSQDYLRFFAFAEEKLIELSELAALAESYNYTELEAYHKNQGYLREQETATATR